jgi:hypothetical protein
MLFDADFVGLMKVSSVEGSSETHLSSLGQFEQPIVFLGKAILFG